MTGKKWPNRKWARRKVVLMACAKAKIPIEEVQISTIYRDQNNSNSHFRSFRDSVRIYKEILKFTMLPLSGSFF